MQVSEDQLHRKITLTGTPRRIVSLVPSQTELLYHLGLETEVVGITKFCVHPEKWFRSKTRIGGTKTLDIEKIKQLHPDLIIANKEENVKEQVEQLESVAPVWVSDVNTYEAALEMILSVGALTGRQAEANALHSHICAQFAVLASSISHSRSLRTAYLIWKEPFMAAGGDTFINDMLQKAGFLNVFANEARYPETDTAQLKKRGTELVLLSSEPYPFREKHIEELKQQLPGIQIRLADGEMFSWYGSRMQYTAAYLQNLHQSLFTPNIL
jgi:ABC-type Fe3+-hydroxamate transport system substrate-binding protein